MLSERERVIALEPYGKGLLGTTLRYLYEVRDAKDYFGHLHRSWRSRPTCSRSPRRSWRARSLTSTRTPFVTATRRRCSRTSRPEPGTGVPVQERNPTSATPRGVMINLVEARTAGGQSPARTSLYWKESASPEFTTKVLDAVDVQLVPTTSRHRCLWKILLLIFVIVGFIVPVHCAAPNSPSAIEPHRRAELEGGRIALRIEAQAQRVEIVIADRTFGLPGRERARAAAAR